jgi:hypothetical protein
MAATTGADATQRRRKQKCKFLHDNHQAFLNRPGKIQRAHSFPVPYSFAYLSEGLLASSLGIFLQPTIRVAANWPRRAEAQRSS